MKNVTNRISQIFCRVGIISLGIACYVDARIERYVSYVTNGQQKVIPAVNAELEVGGVLVYGVQPARG